MTTTPSDLALGPLCGPTKFVFKRNRSRCACVRSPHASSHGLTALPLSVRMKRSSSSEPLYACGVQPAGYLHRATCHRSSCKPSSGAVRARFPWGRPLRFVALEYKPLSAASVQLEVFSHPRWKQSGRLSRLSL